MLLKLPYFIIILAIITLALPLHQAFANDCYTDFPCKTADHSDCCPRTGRYICSSTYPPQSFREEVKCEQNCPEGVCEPGGPYQQCILNKDTGEPECVNPGLVPCGNTGQPACTICDGFVLAQNIIDFIMIDIIPPVAALILAIAGVLFLFTGGSSRRRTQARNLLKNAVIGIVIAYASFLIINSVLTFFTPESASTYFNIAEGGFRIQCK